MRLVFHSIEVLISFIDFLCLLILKLKQHRSIFVSTLRLQYYGRVDNFSCTISISGRLEDHGWEKRHERDSTVVDQYSSQSAKQSCHYRRNTFGRCQGNTNC